MYTILTEIDILGRLSTFLIRETTCDFLLSCTSIPASDMVSTLKGKQGTKCFHFILDPFSDGRQNSFERVTSLESISIPIKVRCVFKFKPKLFYDILYTIVYMSLNSFTATGNNNSLLQTA